MWANIWAHCFWCKKIDLSLKKIFQKKRQRHKIVECLLAGGKLYQHINIALFIRLTVGK